jgi:hypothetical protein
MSPEDIAEIAQIFSRPRRLGRDRFGGRLYDLVQLDDGSITFVRNTLDAQLDAFFAEFLDELFGPEPAEPVSGNWPERHTGR